MKKRMGLWCALCILYLGIHGERLALIDHNTTIQVFPYRVSVYPKAAQALLSQGIPIASDEVLSRVLEDYFS